MNATESIVSVASFSALDYCVFIIILSASMAIGIYFGFFSKNMKTTDDYLTGGHKMKVFPVGISLMASQLSAFSIISMPAEIYSFGWQYMLFLPASTLILLITNYVSLPVFYGNSIENCYMYLDMRFGRATRVLLTAVFVILNLFFSPVVMYIPALAFAEVTGFNVQVINIIICYICVIYTLLGGIKSVVWTDVLQGLVMFASITLVAILGIIRTGGLGEVWDRAVEGGRIFAPNYTMDLTERVTFWNTISSVFVGWTAYMTFSQNCAQRLVSLPTLKHAQRSMTVFFICVILAMGINISTGIIMYSYYHGCDPIKAGLVAKADNLVPRFVQDVAGYIPAMSGIFISCVFSASLSTVSANLHAVAGIMYSDYVRPLKLFAHTDVNANRTMRIIIFVLGTICAFGGIIVEHCRSIFQALMTVSGITTGAKFGVFTIGMLYPWANQKGVLTGIIVSAATVSMIIISAQINKVQYTPIPTSTDQCSNEMLAHISYANATEVLNEPDDDGFAFYKISFQWYSTIGAIMTWIPAIIVSHLTGGRDMNKYNINLISPVIRSWLPESYQHAELKPMNNIKCSAKICSETGTQQEVTELITNDNKA